MVKLSFNFLAVSVSRTSVSPEVSSFGRQAKHKQSELTRKLWTGLLGLLSIDQICKEKGSTKMEIYGALPPSVVFFFVIHFRIFALRE